MNIFHSFEKQNSKNRLVRTQGVWYNLVERQSGFRRTVMLTQDKLRDLIVKYDIVYNHDILPAFMREQTKGVLSAGTADITVFEQAGSFFLHFTPEEVRVFPVTEDWEAEGSLTIKRAQMKKMRVKKGFFMENELQITLPDMMIKMMLPKRMANNPWIKENTIFLESVNYYSR